MLRKKKKRIAVLVKKPFEELALPFEGRRMLIRSEDIQSTQDDSSLSSLGVTKDSTQTTPTASCEQDIICMKSKVSSSNSCITSEKTDRHGLRENSSPISRDSHSRGWNGASWNYMARYNSCVEFSRIDNTHKKKAKEVDYYRMKPGMNTRLRKNGSRTMYKVKKVNNNDKSEGNRSQVFVSFSNENLSNVEMRRTRERKHAWDNYRQSLPIHTNNLPSSTVDNDGSDSLKSQIINHSRMPVDVEPVPCDTSYSGNDGSEDDKVKKEERVTSTSDHSHHLAAGEGRWVKGTCMQHQMSSTPEERGTQTYHIRRERQSEGENGSAHSFVIHINSGPHVNGDLHPQGKAVEVPVCEKRRRGDFTRMRPFIDETMSGGTSIANQTPLFEITSVHFENSILQELPQGVIDSTWSNKTREAPNDGGAQKGYVGKTSSTKKVTKRLIDYLDSTQSPRPTTKTEMEPCIDNTEPEEAIRKSERTSRTRDRKHIAKNKNSSVKETALSNNPAETRLSERGPMDIMSAASSDCLTNQKVASHLITNDSNINESPDLQQASTDSLNEFASANVNVNTNTKLGISRPKVTIVQSDECRHTGGVLFSTQQPYVSNVDLHSRVETNCNHNGCASVPTIHKREKDGLFVCSPDEENSDTNIEFDFNECHNRNDDTDRTRCINFQYTPKNRHIMSRGSYLRKLQTPATFNRIFKPHVIRTSDSATQTERSFQRAFSGPYAAEYPNDALQNRNRIISPVSHKQRSSFIVKCKSPQDASTHKSSFISSVVHRRSRSQSPQLSSSNNSRNFIVIPPQVTHCCDENTCASLQQTLGPANLQNSQAINLPMQNENHSNRMNCICEGHHGLDRSFVRISSPSLSPPPRICSDVTDDTGVATLNVLTRILDEVRAKNSAKTPQGQAECNCSSTPDTYVASNFIGEYLRSLWKHHIFCDTRIIAEEEEFLVHKLVLAAYSSLFCPATPRPEPTVNIEIPNSSPDALRQIFSYMYTSTMTLNDNLLEPVVNAAMFLGAEEIVNIVKDILIHPSLNNINLYNGIIRRSGLNISLVDQQKVYREAFNEIKYSEAFLLLPLDKVEAILVDPEVMVSDEGDTIEVIASWIEYNYLERINKLEALLSHVSFECISPVKLAQMAERYKYIFDTQAGNNFLNAAFKYHALNCANACKPTAPKQDFSVIKDNCEPCLQELKKSKQNDTKCMKSTEGSEVSGMPPKIYSRAPVTPSTLRTNTGTALWGAGETQGSPRRIPLPQYRKSPPSGPMSPAGSPRRIASALLHQSPGSDTISPTDYGPGNVAYIANQKFVKSDLKTNTGSPIQDQSYNGSKKRVSFSLSPVTKENEAVDIDNNCHNTQSSAKRHALSRNNNAFDEAVRFFLKRANNVRKHVHENSNCKEDFNTSNECLTYSPHSCVQLNDLPVENGDRVHGRCQSSNHVTTRSVSRVTGKIDGVVRENSNLLPGPNDCFTEEICSNPDNVLYRNEAEICEPYDQTSAEALADIPISSKGQTNGRNHEHLETEHIIHDIDKNKSVSRSGKLYLSSDDKVCVFRESTSKCHNTMDNVKDKSTSSEKPSRFIRLRGGDNNIDKNISADSLVMLGHQEGTSAFRVYRPAP